MKYIIIDLEATCWDGNDHKPAEMEIIEIGAVVMDKPDGEPVDEFSTFVRPVLHPILSDFCKSLTSIKQEDVSAAPFFSIAFPTMLRWIDRYSPYTICSWGFYDIKQFRQDCRFSHIRFPKEFERHINLKEQFAKLYNVRPCGMEKALRIARLSLTGTHHRGIDDARNIAKLARLVLPKIVG